MTENKKTEEARIVQVATQTAPAFELPNGEVVDQNEILVLTYNMVREIRASLIGNK